MSRVYTLSVVLQLQLLCKVFLEEIKNKCKITFKKLNVNQAQMEDCIIR
jgi:hypothetical protein